MMRYTGERAIPWNKATGLNVMHPHIMRYAWATRFAWNKVVVDLGCGVGYGSFMLSWVAQAVTGVDVDRDAVRYAEAHFYADNLNYKAHNLLMGPPPGHPSLYVAFEVLEHLSDPESLIAQLDAPLVYSVPVEVPNRWHQRTYTTDEIINMIGGAIYYQSMGGDIAYHTNAHFEPAYVLGVTE